MRHGSLVLALALVLGGCGGRSTTSNTGDGGPGSDAIFQLDAAPQDAPVQVDVAPQQDAPAANWDTGAGLIPCGSETCVIAAGEQCCVGTSLACGTTCQYGGLACNGPEDCPTAAEPICCGHVGTGGGGANCAATCGSSDYRLCQVDGDCSGGSRCCGELLGIKYCQPDASCGGSTDGGTPSTPGQVACSGSPCDVPQVCCNSIGTGGVTGTCEAASACTAGLPVACDGPEDCDGDGGTQVCCATINLALPPTGGAVCKPAADCTNPGNYGGILCHSNADCPSGTPNCRVISVMGITVPYSRCQQ
jgi:hypothetical protein